MTFLDTHWKIIGVWAALVLLILWFLPMLIDRDDSDSPTERSGLTLYTDHLTGCQYFGKTFSLTPRMNQEGKQVCIEGGAR